MNEESHNQHVCLVSSNSLMLYILSRTLCRGLDCCLLNTVLDMQPDPTSAFLFNFDTVTNTEINDLGVGAGSV